MARALQALGEQLQAEATCPLCLELFSRPVLTACGHSLCSPCAQVLLGSPPRPAACPQCRATVEPGSLRPNFPLGAVAELAAALEEAAGEEAKRPRCSEHGEALELFCQSCFQVLCPRCREEGPHCGHRTRPAEEAAKILRETLQSNLVFLEKEKEEFNPKGESRINMLMVCAHLCPAPPARSSTLLGVQPFSSFILISFSRTTLLFSLSHPVHPISPSIRPSHISFHTSIPYLLPYVHPISPSIRPSHISFHTSIPYLLPYVHPISPSIRPSHISFYMSVLYLLPYVHPVSPSKCPPHISFLMPIPYAFHTSLPYIFPYIHPVYFSIYPSPTSSHLSIPYNLLYIHSFSPPRLCLLAMIPIPSPQQTGCSGPGVSQGTVASEQQKLRTAFEQLQQFLREQEGALLAQLDGAHARLSEQHREYTCRVSERGTLLEELVEEIQKKRDQPAVEFLMDVAGILDRCVEAKVPVPDPVSSELQRTVSNLCKTSERVLAVLGDFRVDLLSKMDTERVKVLLDLETASRYLTISSDCRTLQIAEGWQNLSDTPKRFTGSASVLGSQGFTAGRHYWELEVGDGNNWAVGVALESVQRKESLMMAMEKIWALRMDWDRSYTALTMPPAPLSLQEEPRRIRVHLDYEAGQVTFYNTDNMQQLLQFKVSFSEKVFPYFWLGLPGTYIKLRS
uniref:Uncharacterized protein n=2 Tax=Gallus gallus TaxID=9031 RepID=A0A8V1AFN9_CHICK